MAHQCKRPLALPKPTITTSFPAASFSSSSPSPPSSAISPRSYSYKVLPPPALPISKTALPHEGLYSLDTSTSSYTTHTASSAPASAIATEMQHQTQNGTYTPTRTRPRAGHRELTPWCGMGGIKGQQWGIWNPSAPHANDTHPDEINYDSLSDSEIEVVPALSPELGNSISGGESSSGPMTPTRVSKRRFFEDEMDEGFRVEATGRTMKLPKRRKYFGTQNREDGFKGWEYKMQIPVGGREVEMGGI